MTEVKGCLPTLARIPVWIGLYRALSNVANEGLLTEVFFWIPSLAGPTTIAAKQSGSRISWLLPFVTGVLLLDGNTLNYFGKSIPINLALTVIVEVVLLGGAEYYRITNGLVCSLPTIIYTFSLPGVFHARRAIYIPISIPIPRYCLRLKIEDATGYLNVIAFENEAETLTKTLAKALYDLYNQDKDDSSQTTINSKVNQIDAIGSEEAPNYKLKKRKYDDRDGNWTLALS
ncbi:hypothetical protein GIB67_023138 [Kingdonia uniflora]|uniref:Uncharacterized protein n=1 Tax=Kingdonia uniflora TaxID=39325 RepID=A0A7J7M5P1_9MAGN|nr:hypothetical protein GIB67_023138 [Kingdonia uniflora]